MFLTLSALEAGLLSLIVRQAEAMRVEYRHWIPIRNRGATDLAVVVEPWASELRLAPGEECAVVLIGDERWPSHTIESHPYGLVLWAGDGVNAHELWRGDRREIW